MPSDHGNIISLGYFLTMTTKEQVHVVSKGESVQMECQFVADHYNLFESPILWRKIQKDEEVQMNIMGNLNAPFVYSNRFEVAFVTSQAPTYSFQLSIQGMPHVSSASVGWDQCWAGPVLGGTGRLYS